VEETSRRKKSAPPPAVITSIAGVVDGVRGSAGTQIVTPNSPSSHELSE
jgi:hypothetical protein